MTYLQHILLTVGTAALQRCAALAKATCHDEDTPVILVTKKKKKKELRKECFFS